MFGGMAVLSFVFFGFGWAFGMGVFFNDVVIVTSFHFGGLSSSFVDHSFFFFVLSFLGFVMRID